MRAWYFTLGIVVLAGVAPRLRAEQSSRKTVYPCATWEARKPEDAGLSRPKLDALRDLVGGRGFVARQGYMVYAWGDQAKSSDIASAVKPIISTLLFIRSGRETQECR